MRNCPIALTFFTAVQSPLENLTMTRLTPKRHLWRHFLYPPNLLNAISPSNCPIALKFDRAVNHQKVHTQSCQWLDKQPSCICDNTLYPPIIWNAIRLWGNICSKWRHYPLSCGHATWMIYCQGTRLLLKPHTRSHKHVEIWLMVAAFRHQWLHLKGKKIGSYSFRWAH